ncbi:MAG: hypothetical protein ACKOJB_09930 [Chthoniobacterales bacterium]
MSAADKKTMIVYDPTFLGHDTGPGFPECPDRLRWLMGSVPKDVEELQPDDKIDPLPWILKVHEEYYVDEVRRACAAGEEYLGSPDSPLSRDSYDVAVRAVVES